MKKLSLYIIGFSVLAGLFSAGCVKLKEVPPGNLATENFYHTTSAFDAAIIGVYEPLFYNYTAWDFNGPFILCYGAEDCTTRPQATDSKMFDELKPSSQSTTLSQCWAMCYKSITNADAILGSLPN